MAIYDKDATPATAVAAWLAQFKVDASGDITFVSGTDTFHVWWLHRALQKIAWDFAISGDDEINLSKPNPSTSEALGTIISLLDHTTDYSVKYTVTDLVMQSHFGGSVSYNGGDDVFYGLKVLGAVATPMPIKILQNNVELTSHWGNGKNQTDGSTLLRIMIKGRTAGVDIDNLLVHAKLSTWQYTYALWATTLGLGEGIASLSSEGDPQNTTAQGTVEAYGITKSEGYNLLNLDNVGNKPFLGEWSYAPESTKKALYEFVKSLLVDGTSETLYGVDGNLWTGRLYDCSITSGSGTHAQNETCSWGSGATAGSGNMVGADDLDGSSTTRYILHLNTGVPPVSGLTITGLASATAVLDADSVALSTHVNFLGQFTGAWIGAYGIGFSSVEIGAVDSFKDLDGNTVTPPNNVTIQGSITCGDTGDDPHIFLAPKDGALGSPDIEVYSCDGNTSGAGIIDVDAIAADTPQAGYFGVLRTGETTYEFYEYSSWTGSQFTLVGTLDGDIVASDPGFHAIFYQSADGAGLVKTVSNSLVYSSDISVVGWVRHGDPTIPDKPVPLTGTVGAGGLSFSATLVDET